MDEWVHFTSFPSNAEGLTQRALLLYSMFPFVPVPTLWSTWTLPSSSIITVKNRELWLSTRRWRGKSTYCETATATLNLTLRFLSFLRSKNKLPFVLLNASSLVSTQLIDMAQKMGGALQVADSLVWTKPDKDSKSKLNASAVSKGPGAPLGTNQALGQAMSSAASYNKNIQLPAGKSREKVSRLSWNSRTLQLPSLKREHQLSLTLTSIQRIESKTTVLSFHRRLHTKGTISGLLFWASSNLVDINPQTPLTNKLDFPNLILYSKRIQTLRCNTMEIAESLFIQLVFPKSTQTGTIPNHGDWYFQEEGKLQQSKTCL